MSNVVTMERNTEMDHVINQCQALIEQGEITQSKIAKEVSLSSSVISQYLNRRYDNGNLESVTEKLGQWLALRNAKRQSIIAPGFVQTQTAKQILTALAYAHAAEVISVVFGASGVGKTTTCREYAQSTNNCWMITASPSCASISECLYELSLELGLDAPRRKGMLSRTVKRRLMGTSGLVIIDEADHLDYGALEELRILQEQTGIGLVLVGNNRVYTQLTGGRRTEDFARLFSRIAKKVGIHKAKQTDVNAIAAAWAINDTATLQLMQQIADKPGALRLLNQTLRMAATIANGKGTALNHELIRAAFKDLEGNE